MRLSCPNCGAQYEVPVEVIPQEGRDVQCSNCGHTWFQMHPDQDAELAADVGGSVPDEGWSPAEDTDIQPDEDLVEDPALEQDASEVQPPEAEFSEPDEEQPETDQPGDGLQELIKETVEDVAETVPGPDAGSAPEPEEAPADEAQPEQRAPRSGIDPAVADVLRQEAEFEAQAREDENRETLETQTELGLQEPTTQNERHAAEARTRMRRIQGLSDETDPEATEATSDEPSQEALDEAAHGARRDLLPDIDEINSTLRSSDDRSATEGSIEAIATQRRRRSGFRLGFGFIMLFAAFVILAYVYNKEIIAAYPAAEPYVIRFMDVMNEIRVWLDTRVTEAMLWLDNIAESAGGNVE